jgi:hypothetical protein
MEYLSKDTFPRSATPTVAIAAAQDAVDEIQSAKSALLGLRRWPSPCGKGGPPDPPALLVGEEVGGTPASGRLANLSRIIGLRD